MGLAGANDFFGVQGLEGGEFHTQEGLSQGEHPHGCGPVMERGQVPHAA